MVDRVEILKRLADRIVSQQALSRHIKPEPSGIDAMEAGNLTEGHVAGVAFELVKKFMQSDARRSAAVINFLLSDGSRRECEDFHRQLVDYAQKHLSSEKAVVDKVKKRC